VPTRQSVASENVRKFPARWKSPKPLVLTWNELSVKPEAVKFVADIRIEDPKTWRLSLLVLALMVGLFIVHRELNWDAWVVAAVGMVTLFLVGRHLQLDPYLEKVEYALLLFFISLFVMVGGVEHSHFLQFLGQHILPFVQDDLLVASLTLLWVSALLSAAIDNIPFTAAMIPIILSMEAQGINVTPLWWCLAMGVGMGGNGTHIGSTANVFIVTLSERLAQKERNPSLAITPGLWFRKGTPAMLATLVVCTLLVTLFFEFFSAPIHIQ
jgi:Na+/H+ antiporter NhaD/arsenite permease-like protein